MIRRWIYLLLLFASLFFSSLVVQTSVNFPASAIKAADEFREIKEDFCVTNQVGEQWSIRLKTGAVGLMSSKLNHFKLGDCLNGRLQLSRVQGFSRYAFHAKLKEIIGSVESSPRFVWINRFRDFASGFKGDSLNLISGLAIGIDSGLSEQFKKDMKATGLTHLTAVSGANCAIVLGALWFLLKRLRVGKGVRFTLSIVGLVCYVTLVGYQPSVLRAAFMMSVALFAFEFGRRVWVPGALILGSLLLLVVDPWLIVDYGFWLSVLATFGLVVLTPQLIGHFEKYLPRTLAIGLAATLAAQLWCLPLLLQLQGGFTTYSILANLLVEPVVPVITLFGLLGTILGSFAPPIGSAFYMIANVPASWIVWVASSLSAAPSPLIALPWLISIPTVIALTIAIIRKNFRTTAVASVLILVLLGGVVFRAAKPWPISNWSVVGCDVGQGDALVLRSNSEIAVVDVGKDPDLIDACLDRLGIRVIDLLVLTHFDFDHVGGLPGLERGRRIETVLISPFPDERAEARFLKENLQAIAGQVVEAQLGLAGKLGRFDWQVFSSLAENAVTANQGSLGMKFEDESAVIYTLADLDEIAQCKASSWARPSSKITIVKVSHHGSADQCEDFYQAISPDIALISVGKGNPYGHPTSKTLRMLDQLGSNIFRTDTQGAVSLAFVDGGVQALVAGSR